MIHVDCFCYFLFLNYAHTCFLRISIQRTYQTHTQTVRHVQCMQMHTYTHTCMHAHMCVHMYTHTHTHVTLTSKLYIYVYCLLLVLKCLLWTWRGCDFTIGFAQCWSLSVGAWETRSVEILNSNSATNHSQSHCRLVWKKKEFSRSYIYKL